MLVVMAGLPGSGKSTLARGLAAALPAVVLDKDPIRAALFPAGTIEYSTRQDDFCQSIMLQVAAYLLEREPGRPIVLDGRPFARRYQRAQVVEAAHRLHTPLRVVECVCADETARRRLEHDAAAGIRPARNRDYDLYLAVKAGFEPIALPKLTVDTDQSYQRCLDLCLEYIRAGG
jgi:predicted kinase